MDIQTDEDFEKVVAEYLRMLDATKELYQQYKEENKQKDLLYRSLQQYMIEKNQTKPVILEDERSHKKFKLRIADKTKYEVTFNKDNLIKLLGEYLEEKLHYSPSELQTFADSFDEFIDQRRRDSAYKEPQLDVKTVKDKKRKGNEDDGPRKRKYLKSLGAGVGDGDDEKTSGGDAVDPSPDFQKVNV